MAKAPAADSIMAPDKMKPLLALSKREPVQAAIGLSSDGEGIILLDKKAKPRKVASMLRASASKAKLQLNTATLRFGRAEVDTEYDSSMVRFFINKDAPGNMRVKLVEVVKRMAYQKVELNVDPTLEQEPEAEEAETEEGSASAGAAESASATAPAQPIPPAPPTRSGAAATMDAAALAKQLAVLIGRIAQAAGGDTTRRAELAGLAGDANGKLKAKDLAAAAEAIGRLREALDAESAPEADALGGLDADAMRKELMGLAGGIADAAGDDAARKAQLAKLAMDGNVLLKGGNLPAAANAIARLREALEANAGSDKTSSNGPAGPNAAWLAAADGWRDANDAVNDQINALRTAILKAVAEGGEDVEGVADDLAEIADKGLNALTEGHRVPLMASVQEIGGGDPAALAKFGARALEHVLAYQSFLESSEHISVCDDNPFEVAVSIRPTLVPILQQMAKVLQAATAEVA